jgi:hypothetical protein
MAVKQLQTKVFVFVRHKELPLEKRILRDTPQLVNSVVVCPGAVNGACHTGGRDVPEVV